MFRPTWLWSEDRGVIHKLRWQDEGFSLIKVKEFLHKCQPRVCGLWTLPDRPERKTWLQMPNDSKWLPNQLWNTPVISKLSCLTHSKSGSLLCPPSFLKHTHWKMVVSVGEFSIWRKKNMVRFFNWIRISKNYGCWKT